MKILERQEYAKETISIEQIVWETETGIYKETHVLENMGDCLREVNPSEPIFTEMIIFLHNSKHNLTPTNQ